MNILYIPPVELYMYTTKPETNNASGLPTRLDLFIYIYTYKLYIPPVELNIYHTSWAIRIWEKAVNKKYERPFYATWPIYLYIYIYIHMYARDEVPYRKSHRAIYIYEQCILYMNILYIPPVELYIYMKGPKTNNASGLETRLDLCICIYIYVYKYIYTRGSAIEKEP